MSLDIVIDVDGTIADIVTGLEEAFRLRGVPVPPDFRHLLGTAAGGKLLPEPWRTLAPMLLAEPGFAISIPWYEGAADFCQDLIRDGHNVMVLTAPYDSHTWVAERFEWLRGIFDHNEVIFCPSDHKRRVRADVLVEDRADIVREWAIHHPKGLAILVDRPWNQDSLGLLPHLAPPNVTRVRTYAEILELVK